MRYLFVLLVLTLVGCGEGENELAPAGKFVLPKNTVKQDYSGKDTTQHLWANELDSLGYMYDTLVSHYSALGTAQGDSLKAVYKSRLDSVEVLIEKSIAEGENYPEY